MTADQSQRFGKRARMQACQRGVLPGDAGFRESGLERGNVRNDRYLLRGEDFRNRRGDSVETGIAGRQDNDPSGTAGAQAFQLRPEGGSESDFLRRNVVEFG